MVAAAAPARVAARAVQEADGRERENNCMMIDRCTDLQNKAALVARGGSFSGAAR